MFLQIKLGLINIEEEGEFHRPANRTCYRGLCEKCCFKQIRLQHAEKNMKFMRI